jgi:outer membrane biosynthesis protein TonB
MSAAKLQNEDQNRNKSLRISVTIHILILLLALYPLLKEDPEQSIDTQFSIAINFANAPSANSYKGTAEEGVQRPRNENIERVRTAPVDQVNRPQSQTQVPEVKIPNPTPVETVESDIFEESEIVAIEEVPEETIPVDITPAPANNNANAEPVEIPVDISGGKSTKANDSGTNSSQPSNKDGTGTGQGTQGTGSGKDKTGNDASSGAGTGGPGTGIFDGTGDGIFGRQPVSGNAHPDLIKQNGRITMKVCINKRGMNTYVEIIQAESTIKDSRLQRLAMDSMAKYIWEEDYSAAPEQCGKYTYNFKGL